MMNQLSLLVSPLVSRLNVSLVSPATLGSIPPGLVVGVTYAIVLGSTALYATLRDTYSLEGQLTPQRARLLAVRHALTCCAVIAGAVGVLSQVPALAMAGTAVGAALLIWAAIDLLRARGRRNPPGGGGPRPNPPGGGGPRPNPPGRPHPWDQPRPQPGRLPMRGRPAPQPAWPVQQPHPPARPQGTVQMPRGVRGETQAVQFRPIRQEVIDRPTNTLRGLQQTLQIRNWGGVEGVARDISVNFHGEDGADAGGLRRHFWSLLGQYLCRERNDNHFLPARERGGLFVPDLTVRQLQADQRRAQEGYRQLGEVMSWGARHGLLLHPLFTLGVFNAIRAHLNGEFDRVGLIAGIEEADGLEACFPTGERSDAHWQWLANRYGVSQLCQDDAAWWGMDLQAQKARLQQGNTVQRLVAEISQEYRGIADAIGALVEGIGADVGERGLAELSERSAEELKRLFLGELTADLLIQSTRCDEPQHRQWLCNWIRRQPARKLQALVFAIRGSSALLPDQTISFNIQQRRDFSAHTCGGSVEMPAQQNERDFGQALDNWLLIESSGRDGFNAW